jgi:hypothetical protein
MRYGFSGSRFLGDAGEKLVAQVLAELDDVTEATTGACVGVDACVGRYLWRTRSDIVHRVVVPADRSKVDWWWTHRCIRDSADVLVEELPAGWTYRDRNERIVDHSDRLVAFPKWPEDDPKSRRSGTWQTVRIATRRGVPVEVYVLSRTAG